MIVFFVILVSINSYSCYFDLDNDIPTINVSSLSTASSLSSSSTGSASSSAIARTTWTYKPKGGSPCPYNETYIFCNARCPTDYCPDNDNLESIACDPPYPCASGCGCTVNFKRKSLEDDSCILASDCLPVNCTRQNEEWNPCPQPCTERCTDLNIDTSECGDLYCDPKCFCKEGYRRNDKDICVTVADCSS